MNDSLGAPSSDKDEVMAALATQCLFNNPALSVELNNRSSGKPPKRL